MRLGRSGKVPKAPRAWLHGAGEAPRKRGTSTGGSGTEPAVASYPGAETLDKDNQKAIESIAYLLKTRQGSRICGRTLEETTFGRTEYDNWSLRRATSLSRSLPAFGRQEAPLSLASLPVRPPQSAAGGSRLMVVACRCSRGSEKHLTWQRSTTWSKRRATLGPNWRAPARIAAHYALRPLTPSCKERANGITNTT